MTAETRSASPAPSTAVIIDTAGFPPVFFRLAGIASLLSALTTLGLILLPLWAAPGGGFEARMARVHDPALSLRAWLQLAHPPLCAFAAIAVALRLRHRAPALCLIGALAFLGWAAVETVQQCLSMFAFDVWREAYLAGDPAVRESMPLRAAIHDGLWNALYVLVLMLFLPACALYALAFARGGGIERALAIGYAAAATLTLALLAMEFGLPPLPEPLLFWSYLAIQPAARALLGVWLWREAGGDRADRRHRDR